MALDFSVKDVIHKITAKFVHAFLPAGKYTLEIVTQHTNGSVPLKEPRSIPSAAELTVQ